MRGKEAAFDQSCSGAVPSRGRVGSRADSRREFGDGYRRAGVHRRFIRICIAERDGDKLTWKLDITVPMPMTLDGEATVDGDTITGTVTAGAFGAFPLTGTRVG